MARDPGKPFKQVAALPVRYDETGRLRVLLVTSRETHRFIIPKGWPMKGRKDYQAAAIEAREEAGLLGRIGRKPIGAFTYWKRYQTGFVVCRVRVFLLEVLQQLPDWRERHQRRGVWLDLEEAILLADEPGLAALLQQLAFKPPQRLLKIARRHQRLAKPASLH